MCVYMNVRIQEADESFTITKAQQMKPTKATTTICIFAVKFLFSKCTYMFVCMYISKYVRL